MTKKFCLVVFFWICCLSACLWIWPEGGHNLRDLLSNASLVVICIAQFFVTYYLKRPLIGDVHLQIDATGVVYRGRWGKLKQVKWDSIADARVELLDEGWFRFRIRPGAIGTREWQLFGEEVFMRMTQKMVREWTHAVGLGAESGESVKHV